MSDGPAAYTKPEFERLLARAAEREVGHEPRDFTTGDLVEAGRDLGIPDAVVAEVAREHERARASERARALEPLPAKPFDSRLVLDTSGDTFSLLMPPSFGARFVVYAKIVFGLVATGALLASNATWGLSVALAVGTAMLGGLGLARVRTTRELRLERDGSGFLIRHVRGRARGMPLLAGQVRARVAAQEIRGPHGHVTHRPYLALDHGTSTYELLEGESDAEIAWAAEVIERWLGRAPRK